ncbi:MAG: biopolymer transporter ExbD [Lentisphaerae bacterium]|jgi:biopolymer transport protein ExbD|nr:biopolymer transporter ExbD [Lentisphaerota bacterium]
MRKREDDTLETPITSMIDIVFLLIIFFVVTASVDKDVVDESIMLAQAKNAPAVEQSDPRTVTVNLHKNGDINISLQPLSLSQLKQMLISMRAQSGNSVPVLIRCDADTQFRHIDRVMQVAASTGLYRVRLAAEATGM